MATLDEIKVMIKKSKKEEVEKELELAIKNGKLVLKDFMGILEEFKLEWVVNILMNLSTEQGNTLLHLAVSEKDLNAVTVLLEKGADPLIANKKNQLPSDVAEDKYTKKTDDLKKIRKIFEDILYDSSSAKNGYKKPAKTSLHGYIFQVRLLMLCVLYAHETTHEFRLATEFDAAEHFDDIVLETIESKKKVYRFIQSKHRLNVNTNKEKISSKELLIRIKPDDFFIKKYVDSFFKILDKKVFKPEPNMEIELKDLILVTNTVFIEKSEFTNSGNKLDSNDLLFLKNQRKVKKFKICDNKEQTLKKKVKDIWTSESAETIDLFPDELVESNPPQPPFDIINETIFNDFLKKFQIIINFPNEKKLENLIMQKLNEFININNINLNADLVSAYFQKEMLNFLYRGNKGKAIFYTKIQFNNFIEKLRGLEYKSCGK